MTAKTKTVKTKADFPSFLTIAALPSLVTNFASGYGSQKENVFDVSNVEDGLQALRDFCNSGLYGTGYAWGVLMQTDDALTVYYRYSQPCFGEICIYQSDLPAGQRLKNPSAEVHKPGDLYNPFPQGTPLAFVVPIKPDNHEEKFLTQLFDVEVSPWRGCLKDSEIVTNDTGIVGLIINDMDIDPTLMVNLFKLTRSLGKAKQTGAIKFQEENDLVFWKTVIYALCVYGNNLSAPSYYFSNMFDTERFANGDHVNLVEGGTIRERYSYNRPKMEYSFVDPDKPKVNPILEGVTGWGSNVTVKEFTKRLLEA